jgi:hypothetical protein
MERKSYVVSESGVKVFLEYQDNIRIDKDNPILKKKAEYSRERYTRGKVKGLSGVLLAPDRRGIVVRSVWFIETGEQIPRFVTAYPLQRRI